MKTYSSPKGYENLLSTDCKFIHQNQAFLQKLPRASIQARFHLASFLQEALEQTFLSEDFPKPKFSHMASHQKEKFIVDRLNFPSTTLPLVLTIFHAIALSFLRLLERLLRHCLRESNCLGDLQSTDSMFRVYCKSSLENSSNGLRVLVPCNFLRAQFHVIPV